MRQPLLTAEQAAEQLGISRGKVYTLCRSGELTHLRYGKSKKAPIRIEHEAINEYMARSRVQWGQADDQPVLNHIRLTTRS